MSGPIRATVYLCIVLFVVYRFAPRIAPNSTKLLRLAAVFGSLMLPFTIYACLHGVGSWSPNQPPLQIGLAILAFVGLFFGLMFAGIAFVKDGLKHDSRSAS